jgi:hypothetical protein
MAIDLVTAAGRTIGTANVLTGAYEFQSGTKPMS